MFSVVKSSLADVDNSWSCSLLVLIDCTLERMKFKIENAVVRAATASSGIGRRASSECGVQRAVGLI